MRKLSRRRRSWLDHRSRRGHARKRLARQRIRLNRFMKSTQAVGTYGRLVTVYSNGKYQSAILEGTPRRVPEVLSFHPEYYDQTADFIANVRAGLSRAVPFRRHRRARHGSSLIRIGSYWDFATLQQISIPAALVLASEYDRVRQLRGAVPRAVNLQTWNPRVRSLLFDIGFLDLSGVEPSGVETVPSREGKLLRMSRGADSNGERIAEYLQMLGIDLTIEDPGLSDAIMEGITNSVQHAYRHPELCPADTVREWWIAAALEGRRRLRMAIYDQGASIPATLPMWDKYPGWLRAFKRLVGVDLNQEPDPNDRRYDGDAIKLAIEVGRTSTELGGRGKGLHQVVSVLDLSKNGSITIYSRCGRLRCVKGEAPEAVNLRTGIIGTLVVWDLELGDIDG